MKRPVAISLVVLVAVGAVAWGRRLVWWLVPPDVDGVPQALADGAVDRPPCGRAPDTLEPAWVEAALERTRRAGQGLFETAVDPGGCWTLRVRRVEGRSTHWRLYEATGPGPGRTLRAEVQLRQGDAPAETSLATLLQRPRERVRNGWWYGPAERWTSWLDAADGGPPEPYPAGYGERMRFFGPDDAGS